MLTDLPSISFEQKHDTDSRLVLKTTEQSDAFNTVIDAAFFM